ncbi:MAG: GntR family transcriptional regulator [Armatimonadota bacterium]|jgi:GntR family transcriptional regulator
MLNSIDPKSAVPIYLQIIGQIRRQVAAGLLAPGDQLPSVRDLASQLLINPNTAARVYRDLERDGLIETRRGQGTYISPTAAALAEPERARIVSERLKETIDEARGLGLSDGAILNLCQKTLATHRPE